MSTSALRAPFRTAAPALARRLAGLLVCGAALACQPPAPSGGPDGQKPAAKIGTRTVTIAELDERIKENLFKEASEDNDPSKLYELRSEAVEQMIDDELVEAEAKLRGMSKEDLLAAEAQKGPAVSDADVQALYDRFKAQLGTTPFEQVAPQIRARLEQQKHQETLKKFVKSLRDKTPVEVAIEPPRIDVAADGPARGPADAPVTIIEFSDYECPFCKRAEPTVEAISKKYPTQVRLVYRHFPLGMHKLARGAAAAATCADEQGKFWPYHDELFVRSPKLDKDALRDVAGKTGLDLAAFDACVAADKHAAKIAADMEAGQNAKVSGTPAFFINGIPLSGARPLDEFVKLIDREIAAKSKGGAAKTEGS